MFDSKMVDGYNFCFHYCSHVIPIILTTLVICILGHISTSRWPNKVIFYSDGPELIEVWHGIIFNPFACTQSPWEARKGQKRPPNGHFWNFGIFFSHINQPLYRPTMWQSLVWLTIKTKKLHTFWHQGDLWNITIYIVMFHLSPWCQIVCNFYISGLVEFKHIP